jgi:hypothetical protein
MASRRNEGLEAMAVTRTALMITIKRFQHRKDETGEGKPESPTPVRPARDTWNVVMEPMPLEREVIYALSFHRRGTSVYYLYRHYRNRRDAEKEFAQLSQDLHLNRTEFEVKYELTS